VLEQREQAATVARPAQGQRRAHEPTPSYAEPAAAQLDPVARRPLEPLDLEDRGACRDVDRVRAH
jgi:hypothetical protein